VLHRHHPIPTVSEWLTCPHDNEEINL
jgi:hypothetical protein